MLPQERADLDPDALDRESPTIARVSPAADLRDGSRGEQV